MLHRILQQAANLRFDHCDFFSFLPFEGELEPDPDQAFFHRLGPGGGKGGGRAYVYC